MASIDELTEELNQTKHDLQRANLLLEEMNKTVDTLENENNDLSEKIRDLKEELKETKKNLRLEKSSTLSLKKENKDEVNILRKEIEIEKNKQKNILEKLKIESGMEQEMEYLRTDIEEKNNEINLLKEEISILKSKNFEMGMDLDTKNDEYNELVERFNELNENFKDLELVNNENLKEITSLRCNLLEEKVTKNELLQKVEEAEGRIDENVILKNIIESRDLEITQLSDSSKEGVDNEYLVKMENEILEKNILIKNLEKNLKEVEKKNNKLCRMYRNSFIKISEKNNKLDNQNLIIGELKNSLNNEKEKTKLLNEEMNVLEESIFNNNCSIPPLPSALSLEDLKESISNNNRSRPPLPSAPSLEDLKESISNNNCSRPPLPSAPPLTELEENITTNQTDIKKNEVNTINHPLKFTLNLSINGCQEKNVNLLMSNDENKIVQNFMNENINNGESCKKIIIDTCEEKKCFLFYIFDNNNELSKGYGRCGSLSTIVFLELKALLYALEKINFDELNDSEELHIFSSNNKLCKITDPDCIDAYKNNDGLFQKIRMYLRRFKKINILSTDSLDQQSAVTLLMGKKLLNEAGKMQAGYFNLF